MIKEFNGHTPQVHPTAYLSEQTILIGRVTIAAHVSLWPGCVLRGDVEDILVGEETNLQDGVLVHSNHHLPVIIGKGVTAGHGAILHGCTVGSNCLIGMGAILLDGAVVEDNCIVGAGALVTEGTRIPAGSLALGLPARVVRKVTPDEIEKIKRSAEEYRELAVLHRKARRVF